MAHAGRNLQEAETLAHKRVRQYPNQGFCVKPGDKLYCQPCARPIKTEKYTVLRHIGEDEKQSGNSNKGKVHKKKLKKWLEEDEEEQIVDYSNIANSWVKNALTSGLNASQTVNFAKGFFQEI
eukprot:502047_1